MKPFTRFLVPLTLICVLVGALASAATASAEIKLGEAVSIVDGAINPEGDVTRAYVEYDSSTGAVVVKATTAAAPTANTKLGLVGGVASPQTCNPLLLESNTEAFPSFEIVSPYALPEAAGYGYFTKAEQEAGGLPTFEPASKSVEGSVTTLLAAATRFVNQPFSCAIVGVTEEGASEPLDYLVFPLLPKSLIKQPSNTTQTQDATSQAPKLAPAQLTVPASKPVTAKGGKWTKVRITLSNPGGTAVGPISVKLKAPKGIVVKPVSGKLPALLGGQSWTVAVQVKVTEAAKAKSTIGVTAAAGSLTASGSFVVRSAG
jgi:hypothetical protein